MSYEKDIEFMGVNLTVHGSYQPEERQTLEYPGCDEELTVEQVFAGGVEITELLSSGVVEAMQIEILSKHE